MTSDCCHWIRVSRFPSKSGFAHCCSCGGVKLWALALVYIFSICMLFCKNQAAILHGKDCRRKICILFEVFKKQGCLGIGEILREIQIGKRDILLKRRNICCLLIRELLEIPCKKVDVSLKPSHDQASSHTHLNQLASQKCNIHFCIRKWGCHYSSHFQDFWSLISIMN